MRRAALLLTVVVVVAACSSDEPAATTRPTAATSTTSTATVAPLIVEAELAGIVDHLEMIVEGHTAAWAAQDVEAILSYYDDDTIHDDSLFGVLLQGQDLYDMPADFVAGYDGYQSRVLEVFVARSVALVIDEGWGMTLRGTTFTEETPMLEADRIEVDDDGTLGRWSLYYDLDLWEAWGSPTFRMEPAREIVADWIAAWDSGDPAAFGNLYDAGAERMDTLLGTSATGPAEIAAVAADLAGDASVTRSFEFSDSRKAAGDRDIVGAVVEFALPDGCVVRSVALLTAADGLVEHEEIFWDADSLIGCGWAA